LHFNHNHTSPNQNLTDRTQTLLSVDTVPLVDLVLSHVVDPQQAPSSSSVTHLIMLPIRSSSRVARAYLRMSRQLQRVALFHSLSSSLASPAIATRASVPSSSSSSPLFRPIPSLPAQTPRRSMFIQTQSTPNENSLKFLPGRDVSPTQAVDCNSFRDASQKSPLAANLFAIDGVRGVYLGADFISINKGEEYDWALLKPEIYAVIMDFFASGQPVIREDSGEEAAVSSTTILETDSEIVAMIKELIETRIRPAVQEDGGDIDYKSFDEKTGKVLVQMQGSCKGCSSSAVTLKNGIENMLRHYVPEVTEVEEFVDEVRESVSEEQLRKLEEKLNKQAAQQSPQPIPTASPV